MEQKEKIEKPVWVKVIEEDYNPFVHQFVGNMCGSVIQGFLNIVGLNSHLADAVLDEMRKLFEDNKTLKNNVNDD